MGRRAVGVPRLERVEAIVDNPAIYQLAELIPEVDPTRVADVDASTPSTCG